MSYLMEIHQDETRNIVGIFASKASADTFLTSIPFVEKHVEHYGVRYVIPFTKLPELYVAEHRNWRYVFSRCSYQPECDGGEIEITLTEVSDLDAEARDASFPKGSTRLDAYTFPNDKIQCEVEKRMALFEEARAYYGQQERAVARGGLGSQDGEYVMVAAKKDPSQMRIAFLLEPQSTAAREQSASFEEFLRKMQMIRG